MGLRDETAEPPNVFFARSYLAAFLFTDSKSRRYLRWLVFGSSTYYLYAFVASILAALISSLIWNRYMAKSKYK